MVFFIIAGVILFLIYLETLTWCWIKKKASAQQKNSPKLSKTCNINSRGIVLNKKQAMKMTIGCWAGSLLRYLLHIVGYIPSHTIRNLLYKYLFLMNIGEKVTIYYGAEIRAPWNITIGEGTIIGDCAKLDGRSGLVIGKNVNFSTGVWIWTVQHNVDDTEFSTEEKEKPVEICDYCWLGPRTIILPGVKIGTGTVIAAGAVVTKDCEEYSFYAGIPAKKIRERNRFLTYDLSNNRRYHFL